jgi:hypothetical protein
MRTTMKKNVLAGLACTLAAGASLAHEGHGMPGDSHWHATDALGFAAAIGAALVLAWWSRRK